MAGKHLLQAQFLVQVGGLQHEGPRGFGRAPVLPVHPAQLHHPAGVDRRAGHQGPGGGQPVGPEPAPGLFQAAHGPGPDRRAVGEQPQVLGQGQGRAVAVFRLRLQAPAQDRLQVGGQVGLGAAPGREHPAPLEDQFSTPAGPGVGHFAEQGEMQGDPQGEDVGGRPHQPALAQDLLGRHEGGGAQDPRSEGQGALVQGDGQAEVADEGDPAPAGAAFQQDVGGLEVPVDELHPVRRVDRLGHLGQDGRHLQDGELEGGLGQGRAPHQLHGDLGNAAGGVHVIEVADVGMDHAALDLGFVHEPDQARRLHLAQHLQGHGPAEHHVPGFPHLARPALAEDGPQDVAAQARLVAVQPVRLMEGGIR